MDRIKSMDNKKRVLQSIIKQQASSRAEIAKLLGLSKPTVSDIVKQLIDENWITEKGHSTTSLSTGGRKPVILTFNNLKSYIVGVDIGGTTTIVGLVDLLGNIVAHEAFDTQRYLENDFIFKILETINDLKNKLKISKDKILGMGIGVPGRTNVETGVVVDAPALKWQDYPLVKKFNKYVSYPVYIDNDVNSIVLGEYWQGDAKDKKNIIYIAIGTGIGSGIILNGALYRGSHYSAGEMGYLVTKKDDINKYEPVHQGYGHLESVASGSSIGAQLSNLLGKNITAKEAFDLYKKEDKQAIEVIDNAIENLAIGIANYVSLFDPELIILGGGVSQSFDVFQRNLFNQIEQHTPHVCEIIKTSLDSKSSIIGAAALFLKEKNDLISIN